jgi:hypothetical protein
MDILKITKTDTSPEVVLDSQNSIFHIKGKAISADAKEFFEPLLNWFDNYALSPNESTEFKFDIEYFNISTSKMILFVLYKLNDLYKAGNNVKVIWYYRDEDDDMFEVGEDYAFMVDVPFIFQPIHETSKQLVQ